jgi:hypothetical protein
VSNLQFSNTISGLVDQLKTAYDELNNAYDRAQKESIKSDLSEKTGEINVIIQKTVTTMNRALSRGIVDDLTPFLLDGVVAENWRKNWNESVSNLDKAECTSISSEITKWATEVLEDINVRWSRKLVELEQYLLSSVATIRIVKPEKNFSAVTDRLELLKRPNGGFRSISDVATSMWENIVEGQLEIQRELETINDIPNHVMDFLRRRSVSLAEFESEDFQPTREWISSNPVIADGLIVKWGN